MADEKKSSGSITSAWLERHSELYQSAIRAPFILSIRNGTLPVQSYTRWLEQDYLFVKSFVRYIASILAKTPSSVSDEEVDALLGALKALQDELQWFRCQALKLHLSFDRTVIHETTQSYCKFLDRLSAPDVEYPIALSTLWIIEAVYNESFATCLEADAKTAPEFQEACHRWGNNEFRSYCMGLKGLADRALEKVTPEIRDTAESLFQQVLSSEIQFWSMSFDEEFP